MHEWMKPVSKLNVQISEKNLIFNTSQLEIEYETMAMPQTGQKFLQQYLSTKNYQLSY